MSGVNEVNRLAKEVNAAEGIIPMHASVGLLMDELDNLLGETAARSTPRQTPLSHSPTH